MLDTFVQVTTPANALISRITDRMPAILPREAWPLWLGEIESPLAYVKAVLRTFDDAGAWTMSEQPTKARATKRRSSPEPTRL
jgi:putative SOS response-associated peptidase YedK